MMEEQHASNKLAVLSFVLSSFSTIIPNILTGLLLINLASSFNVPLGVMSQIRSTRSVVIIIAAIGMGALSVRFNHKSLLLLGLFFSSASALGCGLAPDYVSWMIFFSIGGLGVAIVNPILPTIVGERYALAQRSRIVGWLVAAAAFSYVVGAPIISSIATLGGWRLAFLGYVFVCPFIALVLVVYSVPSLATLKTVHTKFFDGFSEVYSNRSAIASIIAIMFASIGWQTIVGFHASFIREQFFIPQNIAAILVSLSALSFTCGSLVSGRFVNKYGRKAVISGVTLVVGMLAMGYLNVPTFWITEAMVMLGCVLTGIRYAASTNLALEQIPLFRGTMMALNTVAINLGAMIGSIVGGTILLLYDWNLLGVVLGASGIIASFLFFQYVADPEHTPVASQRELQDEDR